MEQLLLGHMLPECHSGMEFPLLGALDLFGYACG